MAGKEYAQLMARYNIWQNDSILAAAGTLPEAERKKDRGAFFRSIEGTLSHLFWADRIWLSRFADTPPPPGGIPESVGLIGEWEDYRHDRRQFDLRIRQWAEDVPEAWFDGDLSWYSGAAGREITRPKRLLVVQLFNHQTHHRGQVHAMLTAAGARPADTDLPFMPDTVAGD